MEKMAGEALVAYRPFFYRRRFILNNLYLFKKNTISKSGIVACVLLDILSRTESNPTLEELNP
jgi:hypothetical protein